MTHHCVPLAAPAAEIGQQTRLSGLDRPQQNRQPLSWRAQTRGFGIPYGTKQGDPIKWSVLRPAGAVINVPTKLHSKLSRPDSVISECRPPGAVILALTETP